MKSKVKVLLFHNFVILPILVFSDTSFTFSLSPSLSVSLSLSLRHLFHSVSLFCLSFCLSVSDTSFTLSLSFSLSPLCLCLSLSLCLKVFFYLYLNILIGVYFVLMLFHYIVGPYEYIEACMYLYVQNIHNTICFHVWKTCRCILTGSTFHGNPIKAWSIPIFSPSKPFLVSNFTVEKKSQLSIPNRTTDCNRR